MPDNSIPQTLQLALDAFLLAKEGEGVSHYTHREYRRVCRRFLQYVSQRGVTSPAGITPAHVRAYFAELHRSDYSQHTIHDYARPVKTLLRFWYADGIITADVMAGVKMPSADRRVLPAYTEAEIRRLLAACRTLRETALVLFLLDTGVRAAECCALLVTDFDSETGAVMVARGKGGKGRTVYTGSKARRALVRYLLAEARITGPLFPSERTGAQLGPNGLLQVLHGIGKRAGVRCTAHKFRRTFALWALRSGMDIRRLAALLGHSSLNVVQQYLSVTEHDLAGAHRDHGPVDSLLARGGKR